MRILIEPGSYRCQNMGDMAMLQVAVARLTAMHPNADLRVLTNDSAALAAYCPAARPVPAVGRAQLLDDGLHHRTWLRARGMVASVRALVHGGDSGAVWSFLDALESSDLILIAGQGSMGDATSAHARIVLATLGLAQQLGRPSAMVGQGIGPLRDPALAADAAAVLPAVGLIALREGRTGPALLSGLGVPRERIRLTGDDAIELAYGLAPPGLGQAIGLNLRVAGNAGVDGDVVEPLRRTVRELSRELGAELLPVPIARGQARDAEVLRSLLSTVGAQSDGGVDLDSPAKVITQVGRCRIVVTGAYHAAVFALAQGIPVVFLAESEYYRTKYEGLADQFGQGCELVLLRGAELPARLRAAALTTWERAETYRPTLRRAAEEQVSRGRETYREVLGLGEPSRLRPAGAAQ